MSAVRTGSRIGFVGIGRIAACEGVVMRMDRGRHGNYAVMGWTTAPGVRQPDSLIPLHLISDAPGYSVRFYLIADASQEDAA